MLTIVAFLFSFGGLSYFSGSDNKAQIAPINDKTEAEPSGPTVFVNDGEKETVKKAQPQTQQVTYENNVQEPWEEDQPNHSDDYIPPAYYSYGQNEPRSGNKFAVPVTGSGTTNIDCYEYLNSCSGYNSNGGSFNVDCYEYLNSCSGTYSNGTSFNIDCYEYLNSCTTRDSNGNYYDTSCYEYLNSCDTRGPDGYHSTTDCYEYLNSCTTRDSKGNYYDTYCYEYINSCTITP